MSGCGIKKSWHSAGRNEPINQHQLRAMKINQREAKHVLCLSSVVIQYLLKLFILNHSLERMKCSATPSLWIISPPTHTFKKKHKCFIGLERALRLPQWSVTVLQLCFPIDQHYKSNVSKRILSI